MPAFTALDDLPNDIQDMFKCIRGNDYQIAAGSIKIPAIGNRTLLDAANGNDGVNEVRQYLKNAIGKFF